MFLVSKLQHLLLKENQANKHLKRMITEKEGCSTQEHKISTEVENLRWWMITEKEGCSTQEHEI